MEITVRTLVTIKQDDGSIVSTSYENAPQNFGSDQYRSQREVADAARGVGQGVLNTIYGMMYPEARRARV